MKRERNENFISIEKKMNLEKLDRNCLSHIFHFLDLSSLNNLSRVNKRMQEIGSSDLVWKKKYELYFQLTTIENENTGNKDKKKG